jgi:hypothetical protein
MGKQNDTNNLERWGGERRSSVRGNQRNVDCIRAEDTMQSLSAHLAQRSLYVLLTAHSD